MHLSIRALVILLLSVGSLMAQPAVAAPPPDPVSVAMQVRIPTVAFGAPMKYGPCTLYPSVLHPRHSKPGYIGPKPYTKCEVHVASIHQVTELDYEWFAWWKQAVEKSGGNTGQKVYRSKSVEFKCRSTESTVWAGTTAGTVVFKGHTYYVRVWQKQVRLPCGA